MPGPWVLLWCGEGGRLAGLDLVQPAKTGRRPAHGQTGNGSGSVRMLLLSKGQRCQATADNDPVGSSIMLTVNWDHWEPVGRSGGRVVGLESDWWSRKPNPRSCCCLLFLLYWALPGLRTGIGAESFCTTRCRLFLSLYLLPAPCCIEAISEAVGNMDAPV